MQKLHGTDPSTVAALHPGRGWDLRFRRYKTSVRVHGSHHMMLRQPSRTPESSREFAPGDPVSMIDWKAFARTDQVIIREVRDEASARVGIMLDVSESMRWPDEGVPPPAGSPLPTPKMEVAFRIACDLAHAHLRAGDLVHVWVLTDGRAATPSAAIKPRSPSDLMAIFHHVHAQGFRAEAIEKELSPQPYGEALPFDVVWWVGDALGAGDIPDFLSKGRVGGLLHVLSSMETDIGWIQEETSYFDEGVGRREYQGQVLRSRDGYLRSLEVWRSGLEKTVRTAGLEYLGLTDKTSIAAYQAYLTAAARAG